MVSGNKFMYGSLVIQVQEQYTFFKKKSVSTLLSTVLLYLLIIFLVVISYVTR